MGMAVTYNGAVGRLSKRIQSGVPTFEWKVMIAYRSDLMGRAPDAQTVRRTADYWYSDIWNFAGGLGTRLWSDKRRMIEHVTPRVRVNALHVLVGALELPAP